ncbi:MAG: cytochrome-c oxidase [Candidatus Dadabacteria bacterium]|nr:MAG: cytochrome-c oxidase [Candidatus Dadabacteria bacterium]
MSNDIHNEDSHIVPESVFRRVLAALLFLTVLTVVAAKWSVLDFGEVNVVIAMVIASLKAALVVLFFMHLKYENVLTWIYVIFPLFLLFIMMGGLFIDTPFR